jgi:hypothetical protein
MANVNEGVSDVIGKLFGIIGKMTSKLKVPYTPSGFDALPVEDQKKINKVLAGYKRHPEFRSIVKHIKNNTIKNAKAELKDFVERTIKPQDEKLLGMLYHKATELVYENQVSDKLTLMQSQVQEMINDVVDEEHQLEEMSVTANVAPYQTPYAFVDRRKAASKDDDEDEEKEGEKDISGYTRTSRYAGKLKEGKSRYHCYRDEPDMSPRQKVSKSIREVNKMLSEIEKLVDMNCRLKSEMDVNTESYWKPAHRQLNYIEERISRITEKIRGLR